MGKSAALATILSLFITFLYIIIILAPFLLLTHRDSDTDTSMSFSTALTAVETFGFEFPGSHRESRAKACVQLLLDAGADPTIGDPGTLIGPISPLSSWLDLRSSPFVVSIHKVTYIWLHILICLGRILNTARQGQDFHRQGEHTGIRCQSLAAGMPRYQVFARSSESHG